MIIDWDNTVTTPGYIGPKATDDLEVLRDPRHERIHRDAEHKGFACAICEGYW